MRDLRRCGLLFVVLLSTPVLGFAGDAAAGKAKMAVCAGCHGNNGISGVPNYPNLAGQKQEYLVKAIKDYQSGARADPTMKAMVSKLADADIEDLAAYYSSLSCK